MKYALIGCGRIAVNHIKAALNNKLEIVAVCDVLPEAMETLLAKHGLEKDETIARSTDYKTMLAEHPEIQLASIPAMEKMAALDPTFPDILRSCARESALIERTLWAEQEEGAEQEMLARGIVVTELSSEEKQKFRAAVQPLYDQFADQSELIARIQNS